MQVCRTLEPVVVPLQPSSPDHPMVSTVGNSAACGAVAIDACSSSFMMNMRRANPNLSRALHVAQSGLTTVSTVILA